MTHHVQPEEQQPGGQGRGPTKPGAYIAIGVAIGAAIGVALGNIGMGIGVGVAIGVGMAVNRRDK